MNSETPPPPPPKSGNMSLVNQKASKLAALFLQRLEQTQAKDNVSFRQAFKVYQILSIPSDVLTQQSKTGRERSGSIYRKLALEVHPDKNSHPMAM
jgi:hypothetical protein